MYHEFIIIISNLRVGLFVGTFLILLFAAIYSIVVHDFKLESRGNWKILVKLYRGPLYIIIFLFLLLLLTPFSLIVILPSIAIAIAIVFLSINSSLSSTIVIIFIHL